MYEQLEIHIKMQLNLQSDITIKNNTIELRASTCFRSSFLEPSSTFLKSVLPILEPSRAILKKEQLGVINQEKGGIINYLRQRILQTYKKSSCLFDAYGNCMDRQLKLHMKIQGRNYKKTKARNTSFSEELLPFRSLELSPTRSI